MVSLPKTTKIPPPWTSATRDELYFFCRAAKAPRIRSLREFAEQELIIPEGKHKGERFDPKTLPYAVLLLDEIDSGRWRKFRVTGCVQGGKTLMLFVLPVLYYLFEWAEPVIAGVPTMNMAGDKWRKELLPAITANPRFEAQLKDTGKGSKGGTFELMEFANGAMLRFMSGQGGDEVRSGFTARILVVTEADRVDDPGESSDEAAPIYQMEARTNSEAEDARLFAECTTTIESGFIWQEYTENSTTSKIMCPCPHCGYYVCPEREHLVGWEDAENEVEAYENATFICPHCAVILTADERRAMNEKAKLVHKGQTITRKGVIRGEPPKTYTLGFRWNAFNNLFWSAGFVGLEEWKAKRAKDQHSAELKMRQWYWAMPAAAEIFDETPLTLEDVMGRTEDLGRGRLPVGTLHLSCGVDIRKTQLHFAVIAWFKDSLEQWRGHVIDFGTLPVESRKLGVRKAIRTALERLHKHRLGPGYGGMPVGWRVIDSGWQPEPVRAFVRKILLTGQKIYLPSIGRGDSVPQSRGGYKQPDKISAQKPHIGEQYYIAWSGKHRLHSAVVNSDHWKSSVHDGFAMEADQPGALTVWQPTTIQEQQELRVFARHLVSEKAKQKFVPGKGWVTYWENTDRLANHYLDAVSLASVGGHLCGAAIADETPRQASPAPSQPISPITPDGSPYLITDRE